MFYIKNKQDHDDTFQLVPRRLLLRTDRHGDSRAAVLDSESGFEARFEVNKGGAELFDIWNP